MTLTEAVHNNARWCDLVCRANANPGEFTSLAWTAKSRTPLYYPDAVTLDPAATAADVLPGIDVSSGCSIKDSFATLDLEGFEVLFTATWITCRPSPGPSAWTVVRDPEALRTANFGLEVFPVDDSVFVLGDLDGDHWRGGAIVNLSGEVAGLSNLFTTGDLGEAWSGVTAAIATRFPERPIVGYEHGDDLTAAWAAGFKPLGDLRVWLKP
ncbi:hypothetical protein SAMN05421504_106363 [Amycolatopsis xylanica]|uniref:Uncharacterized protein n=1 Tax=Amycolatopsis xylanica TaxID=589385 RepID=A0A1H3LUL7_9PSEU|nr:hypothetical protein [Amycolatopsis xylanica]SDY68081.1 hypothetical protein SAMN05421504_106363 [Amycolatopsis xylanica]